MQSRSVDTISSNEQHVRLLIFDGVIPLSEAGAELLRIEKAQNVALRRELADVCAELARLRRV